MGYNSADKTDKQYVSLGVGFANVGDEGVFKLGQMVPVANGWKSASDMLQVLRDTNAGVAKKYVYYGKWEQAEDEEVGWWDANFDDMYDDLEFPIGTAFLGNFAAKDVAFQQSGSVLTGGTTLDFGPNEEKGTFGKQYVMFGNILPKEIKLGDIVPFSGCWKSASDMLQVLRDTNAGVAKKYVYYGKWEQAEDEEVGWWDANFDDMYNDLPVYPGDAWLGNFAAKDVKLAFPGALD